MFLLFYGLSAWNKDGRMDGQDEHWHSEPADALRTPTYNRPIAIKPSSNEKENLIQTAGSAAQELILFIVLSASNG